MLNDRLLIEHLLVGLPDRNVVLHTTAAWYFRACRAAVIGAGGHLSGPFGRLPTGLHEQAILGLLALPATIGLPDPRTTVPVMAKLAARHPQLNLLNLEVVAAAITIGGMVWLSPPAARGVLSAILHAEDVEWLTVEPS